MTLQLFLALILTVLELSWTAHSAADKAKTTLLRRTSSGPLVCHLMSTPPSGVICGKRGILKRRPRDVEFTLDQTLSHLHTCAEYCLNYVDIGAGGGGDFESCDNLAYNYTSKLCTLYSGVGVRFVEDPNSDTIIFSNQCYVCRLPCPEPSSLNLLKNGGFEVSSDYYGSWDYRPTSDDPTALGEIVHPGYQSANAFGCTKGGCMLEQTVEMCPDTHYLFSAAVKLVYNGTKANYPTNLGRFTYLRVGFYGFNHFVQYEDKVEDKMLANSWQIVSGSVLSAGNNPRYSLNEISYEALATFDFDTKFDDRKEPIFQAYFDAISLTPLPRNISTTGPNLLENAGFESGKLTPWKFAYFYPTYYNGTHEVLANASLSQSSQYGFFFQDRLKKVYPQNKPRTAFNLTNTIPPTDPDKLYVVSFLWRAGGTGYITLFIGSVVMEIEDKEIRNATKVRSSFRVIRGSAKPQILAIQFDEFRYHDGPTYPQVYVDNVAVYEAVLD